MANNSSSDGIGSISVLAELTVCSIERLCLSCLAFSIIVNFFSFFPAVSSKGKFPNGSKVDSSTEYAKEFCGDSGLA